MVSGFVLYSGIQEEKQRAGIGMLLFKIILPQLYPALHTIRPGLNGQQDFIGISTVPAGVYIVCKLQKDPATFINYKTISGRSATRYCQ